MTRLILRTLSVIAALTGMMQSASAQPPPPNVVNSDAYRNTAMGSGALSVDQPSPLVNYMGPGNANTAVGDTALGQNTTGQINSALGVGALAFNTTGQA